MINTKILSFGLIATVVLGGAAFGAPSVRVIGGGTNAVSDGAAPASASAAVGAPAATGTPVRSASAGTRFSSSAARASSAGVARSASSTASSRMSSFGAAIRGKGNTSSAPLIPIGGGDSGSTNINGSDLAALDNRVSVLENVVSSVDFSGLELRLSDLETEVSNLNLTAGADGKSAYEIAKDNGFPGSELEWLASLKGADGATGPAGPAGPAGAPGQDSQGTSCAGAGNGKYLLEVVGGVETCVSLQMSSDIFIE